MKKMMLMMAAAVLAVAANAATVTWTSIGLMAPNEDGTFSAANLNGGIAYLFYGAQDTAALVTAIEGETFTGAGSLYTKASNSSGAITQAGIGNYSNQGVTLYMVVFSGATIAGSDFYMISTDYTQTFATQNKTYSFSTANGRLPGEWTPVPEPTSFALVGLGVAALALRRRISNA